MAGVGADRLAAPLLDATDITRRWQGLRIAVAARHGGDSAAAAIDAEIKRLKHLTNPTMALLTELGPMRSRRSLARHIAVSLDDRLHPRTCPSIRYGHAARHLRSYARLSQQVRTSAGIFPMRRIR